MSTERTRLSAEQRKAEILNVAAKMANENGLVSVSQRTVGERIKHISRHGVKYHFPTKSDLYVALIKSGLLTQETVEGARDLKLIN